jgi:hypothetical protein
MLAAVNPPQVRVSEFNQMKSVRSALGRKDKGSLAVRDLRGVIPADKVGVSNRMLYSRVALSVRAGTFRAYTKREAHIGWFPLVRVFFPWVLGYLC